jgi:hypothetical protein
MASPPALCEACDVDHAATHLCPACAPGERLMCEKLALVHMSGKKTKDHPLLSFKDMSCQMCADKHAATHWCVDCDVDEQFICLVRAETHKSGKKTNVHRLFAILSERYQDVKTKSIPAAPAASAADVVAVAGDTVAAPAAADADSDYEEYLLISFLPVCSPRSCQFPNPAQAQSRGNWSVACI